MPQSFVSLRNHSTLCVSSARHTRTLRGLLSCQWNRSGLRCLLDSVFEPIPEAGQDDCRRQSTGCARCLANSSREYVHVA